jgi:hypothetical protein
MPDADLDTNARAGSGVALPRRGTELWGHPTFEYSEATMVGDRVVAHRAEAMRAVGRPD